MRKRSIRGKIRSIVRKHIKLDYWYSCYQKRNNHEFQMYARDKRCSTVIIESAEKNSRTDKSIVYYIKSGNSFSGFGAEFRRTLDALFFADYYGFTPVVEYNHEYIYAENEVVNGSNNPFEYYFQQPSCVECKNVANYKRILFKEEHRDLAKQIYASTSSYEQSEEYVKEMGKIITKYISLKPEVMIYINESLKQINPEKKRMIGVHYRGTDYNVGYKNHPKVVKIDDYFAALDSVLQESTEDIKIFLATDEEATIKKFVARYGEKVIFFNDTFRSKDGMPIHFSKDGRKLHKYTLGLEILRDIIALSTCDYLIAGLSQVSYCARFFKYSRNEEYVGKEILSNGVR